jgi:hypothetical protein
MHKADSGGNMNLELSRRLLDPFPSVVVASSAVQSADNFVEVPESIQIHERYRFCGFD